MFCCRNCCYLGNLICGILGEGSNSHVTLTEFQHCFGESVLNSLCWEVVCKCGVIRHTFVGFLAPLFPSSSLNTTFQVAEFSFFNFFLNDNKKPNLRLKMSAIVNTCFSYKPVPRFIIKEVTGMYHK